MDISSTKISSTTSQRFFCVKRHEFNKTVRMKLMPHARANQQLDINTQLFCSCHNRCARNQLSIILTAIRADRHVGGIQ